MKNSPWLTIWFYPRLSVRSAIERKYMDLAIYLAILAGIAVIFRLRMFTQIGADMPILSNLIVISLIGVIVGLVCWFVDAAIIFGIGKLLKGRARFYELLIALGVSLIPIASSVVICILDIFIVGEKLFAPGTLKSSWLLFSNSVTVVLTVWSLALVVCAVVEAFKHSNNEMR